MAVAVAVCKCKKCGEIFTVRKGGFKNRTKANKWVEWKESDYNLCEKCENEIANKEIKEKMKGYKIYEVHYGIYKNHFPKAQQVYGTYNKETKTIKIYLNENEVTELNECTKKY